MLSAWHCTPRLANSPSYCIPHPQASFGMLTALTGLRSLTAEVETPEQVSLHDIHQCKW
jgi:hypothetical protein